MMAPRNAFFPSASMTPPLQIAVVGAGIGGLAAAIALQLAGHVVTVLEPAESIGVSNDSTVELHPSTTRILTCWGLCDHIRAASIEPAEVHYRRCEVRTSTHSLSDNPLSLKGITESF